MRLNPKVKEQLESHLLTVAAEGILGVKGVPHHRIRLLHQHSKKNYRKQHMAELVHGGRIVGDASADHMYRRAIPSVPTSLLLHSLLPDAKLIAVLRDPVDRTYSDFRFFFGCNLDATSFLDCPSWWPVPNANDHRNPEQRFHAVVLEEIEEFNRCIDGAAEPTAQKTVHDNFGKFGRRSSGGGSGVRVRQQQLQKDQLTESIVFHANFSFRHGDKEGSRSAGSHGTKIGSGGSGGLSLNGHRLEQLSKCKQRPDLNRDAHLNHCYSGRPTISIYVAFLVDWLTVFPGKQLLALPLEGLDESPKEWTAGIYDFLGLRPPTPAEWEQLILPPRDAANIKRKTAPVLKCSGSPDVHFGPMLEETRAVLEHFFLPWNAELRRLLLREQVRTVEGYGVQLGGGAGMEQGEDEEDEEEKDDEYYTKSWWWSYPQKNRITHRTEDVKKKAKVVVEEDVEEGTEAFEDGKPKTEEQEQVWEEQAVMEKLRAAEVGALRQKRRQKRRRGHQRGVRGSGVIPSRRGRGGGGLGRGHGKGHIS